MLSFSSGAKSERWLKTKLRSVILAKEKQEILRSKNNTPVSEASSEHLDAGSSLDNLQNKTESINENELQENVIISNCDIKNSSAAVESVSQEIQDETSNENEIEKNDVIENINVKNGHDEEFCDVQGEKNDLHIKNRDNHVLQSSLNLDLQSSEKQDNPITQEKCEDVISPVTESAEDALNYVSSSEDLSEEFNDCISSVSLFDLYTFFPNLIYHNISLQIFYHFKYYLNLCSCI